MTDFRDPDKDAIVTAAGELADVREQTDQARLLLIGVRRELAQAQTRLDSSKGAQLVEANQTLVVTALRAQSEAEQTAGNMARQQVEHALRLKSAQLEAENRQTRNTSRLKSEFISNMSHELRTPLNSIIGFSELLHEGLIPPGSAQHQEFLAHIMGSSRHLLRLINEVLDLSKIEAGTLGFFPEQVDFSKLAGEVLEVLRVSARSEGLEMTMDVDPTLKDIVVDPARLRQVLYNYLSNAIKFSSPGGTVALRAFPETGERFRVEVEDSGMGISAADMPRLFREFQQLDSGATKRHQGTGLGLAATRKLVEAQGGSVGARSTLGKGSVFHAVLPCRAGLQEEKQPVAVSEHGGVPPGRDGSAGA